jgi:hypothetical protein
MPLWRTRMHKGTCGRAKWCALKNLGTEVIGGWGAAGECPAWRLDRCVVRGCARAREGASSAHGDATVTVRA